MNFDAEYVHSDSLTGATIGIAAMSVPPTQHPPRKSRWPVLGGCIAGGATLAAVLVAYAQPTPTLATPEALRVQGQTVSYTAGFAASAGIRTIEVHEAAFSPVISVTGKANFDREQVVLVGANTLGTVRRIAKYEGESVKRGEVLAEIGSALQARREAATSLRERELPRGTLGVALLRSPLDGVVVERRAITGQSVRAERVVFVVANLDRLSLLLELDESQVRELHLGDRVELSHEAAPDQLVWGRVSELAAGAGGQHLVKVGIDNRGRTLRPGQAVTARLFASSARAVLVPNRALALIAGRPSVFVSDGEHSATAEAVTLGSGDGEQTAVRVGLASGQRIVSDGVAKLKAASFL